MIKILFFDYREIESAQGFTRELEQPEKVEGPLFLADAPWEYGNMQLYGSVVKVEGRPFQLWYSTIQPPWHMRMAYAESDDGLTWRRPLFDFHLHEGQKTNILLNDNPHGPAVIYDAADPREDWRYKLLAGMLPSDCICAYHSADGVHWQPARRFPVIGTNPDCPIGFLRSQDGRYAAYHRLYGYGRRVFRSESWDFANWAGEPRLVLEPDAVDPPQTQFYGLGATSYGSYELGTLWIYRTDADDRERGKSRGVQEPELAYSRSGYAWHRAAQGQPFIPRGGEGAWDSGNLQCASAPVFLGDEIRYYYLGTTARHASRWELTPQRAGLGLARCKPDRFVALRAADKPAELLTVAFCPPVGELLLNASTEVDGWAQVEVCDLRGEVVPGYSRQECVPFRGDDVARPVRWQEKNLLPPVEWVRLRVLTRRTALYSLAVREPGTESPYHQFAAANP
jgi:hypothetical protein